MALKESIVAGSLALLMAGAPARTQQQAQQAIPDAPRPQATIPIGNVAPGQGTAPGSSSNSDSGSNQSAAPDGASETVPLSSLPSVPGAPPVPSNAADEPTEPLTTFVEHVDYVIIPFTVKDKKGRLISGIKSRDVQVFENGAPQNIRFFSADAVPLSVALVIDQSMDRENMERVNNSLDALAGAFSSYDEIAVFTYNKASKLVTDYTGAQSPRLTQAIDRAKTSGREPYLAGSLSGPMAQTNIINGYNVDPNTSANRGHSSTQINPPREVHPLNDAILEAAKSLARKPLERRRVIYVISSGNELGSKVKTGEVIKYLLTNNIEVDGTLVGDASLPFLGRLDKYHLPLQMRDNVLVAYQRATGGQIDAEFRLANIEKSYQRIAAEVRTRYTLGYYSPESFIDGKQRTVEVRVLHPDLTVIAKDRYWPAAMEMRTRPQTPAQRSPAPAPR